MTRPRRILVSCVLVILVFFIFYNFSIKPRNQEIEKLDKEHKKVAEMLQTSKGYIAKYKSVRAAYDSISGLWEALAILLPEEEEMPELLNAISDAGRKSNTKFILFKPLSQVPRDFYQDNPIQIKITCSYHALGKFLSKISTLSRLVNVSNFKLKGWKEPGITLEAEFIATAYTTKK